MAVVAGHRRKKHIYEPLSDEPENQGDREPHLFNGLGYATDRHGHAQGEPGRSGPGKDWAGGTAEGFLGAVANFPAQLKWQ